MDSKIRLDYLKLIVTIILAAFGWIIGNHLKTEAEIRNEKRKLATEYLISSFRTFADASKRELNKETVIRMSDAIRDVQLFGSKELIRVTNKFVDTQFPNIEKLEKMNTNERDSIFNLPAHYDLNEIIQTLRDELREELNLEELIDNPNIRYIRHVDDVNY